MPAVPGVPRNSPFGHPAAQAVLESALKLRLVEKRVLPLVRYGPMTCPVAAITAHSSFVSRLNAPPESEKVIVGPQVSSGMGTSLYTGWVPRFSCPLPEFLVTVTTASPLPPPVETLIKYFSSVPVMGMSIMSHISGEVSYSSMLKIPPPSSSSSSQPMTKTESASTMTPITCHLHIIFILSSENFINLSYT